MTTIRVWSVALLLLLAPLASMAKGGVPMFNASCPGRLSVHADQGGPVYVNGHETSLKRFNDNYYEARDSSSGVTLSINRTPDGGVQLSYTGRGGANGICTVGAAAYSGNNSSAGYTTHDESLDREVTCESHGQRQTECDMDTSGEVRMVKQLSSARCVQGQSWGLNRHSVWVTDGCRAEFRNVSKSGYHNDSYKRPYVGQDATLLGACNARAGTTGNMTNRVPVNDDYVELIIEYPDGRYLCMIRNDGMVLSLTRLKH